MTSLRRIVGEYELEASRRDKEGYVGVRAKWLKTPIGQDDRVGSAEFWEREDDLFPEQVWVLEAHQRKGIATAMYEMASRISEKPIANSDRQSAQGWRFRTRLGGLQRFNAMEPKVCGTCGREIDEKQWAALKLIGYQVSPPYEDDLGEVLEMRNCGCQSTLAVQMLFTGADVERGVIFELPHVGGDRKKAQQTAIENLKADRYFYIHG